MFALKSISSNISFQLSCLFFLVVGVCITLIFCKEDTSYKKIKFIHISSLILTLIVIIFFIEDFDESLFANHKSFYKLCTLYIVFISILISFSFCKKFAHNFFSKQITAAYLLTISGFVILLDSKDFLFFIIGLEISSLGLTLLSGFITPNQKNIEASLKTFILNLLATVFIIFSFTIFNFSLGTTNIVSLTENTKILDNFLWTDIGTVFFICALSLKIAFCPFHMWAVDTCEGTYSSISLFFVSSYIVCIFLSFLKFFEPLKNISNEIFLLIFSIFSALSVFLPALQSLTQTSIKRIIAYGSISQLAYPLFLLYITTDMNAFFLKSLSYHILGYSIATFLLFTIVLSLESKYIQHIQINDLRGLISLSPFKTAGLTISLLSLSGVPPTLGFMSKFSILTLALEKGYKTFFIMATLSNILFFYTYFKILKFAFSTYTKRNNILNNSSSFYLKSLTIAFCIILLFTPIFISFPLE